MIGNDTLMASLEYTVRLLELMRQERDRLRDAARRVVDEQHGIDAEFVQVNRAHIDALADALAKSR